KGPPMVAAYRVVVAESKDIAVITVVCGYCESEVSMKAGAITPEACPSCNKPYGDSIKSALVAFARFQNFATEAEGHAKKPVFRFHIKQPD
ncbi:MAG: hypothetical protein WA510_21365, partial [Acidobacteriaceae bacterium]